MSSGTTASRSVAPATSFSERTIGTTPAIVSRYDAPGTGSGYWVRWVIWIVVTRSSNPEGRSLQTATTAAGPSVEDQLLHEVAALNHGGLPTPGSVGVVIGATLAPSAFDLAGLGGVVLAPGFGVQGGTTDTVRNLFAGCAPGTVLPSASRSLLAEGPDVSALRAAAMAECDALRRVLD